MKDWFFLLPEQASSIAHRVDAIIHVFVGVAALAVFLIAGAVIYFAVRYRRAKRPDTPARTRTVIAVEVAWITIPLVVFLTFFVWGARVFLEQFSQAPSNAYQVFVLGKQWMWKFEHPSGRREINEIHLPINRPVEFIMISQDVIHSAFVPAFRLKHDVLPNQYTKLSFEPSRVGRYHLFCSQYCGTNHSVMTGQVVVQAQKDFEYWLTSVQGQNSPASIGKALTGTLQCVTCHKSGSSETAPSLEGLFGRKVLLSNGDTVVADENYIRESILDPKRKIAGFYKNVMPSYRGKVSEEDLMHLIAYLKSVRAQL